MRNKIKHVHNVNGTMPPINPIAANRCINYGIESQHCSIYILNVFDFVALNSFFHVFVPQQVGFEKIFDVQFFYCMY